jgi:hypothetical protein
MCQQLPCLETVARLGLLGLGFSSQVDATDHAAQSQARFHARRPAAIVFAANFRRRL